MDSVEQHRSEGEKEGSMAMKRQDVTELTLLINRTIRGLYRVRNTRQEPNKERRNVLNPDQVANLVGAMIYSQEVKQEFYRAVHAAEVEFQQKLMNDVHGGHNDNVAHNTA